MLPRRLGTAVFYFITRYKGVSVVMIRIVIIWDIAPRYRGNLAPVVTSLSWIRWVHISNLSRSFCYSFSFLVFPLSPLTEYARTVHEIRPEPFPSMSYRIHYSPVIPHFVQAPDIDSVVKHTQTKFCVIDGYQCLRRTYYYIMPFPTKMEAVISSEILVEQPTAQRGIT